MKFPVDLLADVSQAELERLAHNYMNNLLYSNPDSPEHLTLSDSTQVTIDISSVGFVPLYGSSDKQKILALFSPSDPFTAVALYLLDQWWAVDNILKTADPARDGAVEVETVGERIVLYILNRVIYRAKEMSSEELPFLCHGEKDNAKIFWNNGEAVGFYSVKPSGSLCNSFSTRSYQLPVMNSIFVRKCQRGKGIGLQMLEDFVLSFKEDCLGLRYPLTKSMYKVCEKYLCQYPGDTDLLWEVESIGGPNQRTNIASKIQAMDLSAVSKSLLFIEESLVIPEVTEKDVVMEAITTQIKEAESMECTVEILEEVTVLQATKVSARGRSSGSKHRKMGENITEDKSEKVIRIEDIEAETPREEQVSAQLKTASELIQTEGIFSVAPEEKGEDVVDAAPDVEAATMSTDKPAAVLASHHLEEADVTSAPTAEEQQVEDYARQDLNNTSHDSQITVENVASEIEEAEETCQKEDTAMLVDSEEVLEVHKEAETLNKVREVTDEKLEEKVTQHEVSLSTLGEVGKTGRTVVKAIKTVHSETPIRRSQRHSKPEEEVKEETAAQGGGRLLRGRTVMNTPIPKCKYAQHSQKVCEELEKEVNEMADENKISTTEIVDELAVTEGEEPEKITSIKEDVVAVEELREKQQLDNEQLTNEEETEKQEEPDVEDTAVKGSTERLNTAENALINKNEDEKVTDESEKEQEGVEVETSMRQDKQEASGNEIQELPVAQKRALRGRHTVTPKPKPTKQSKRHQKQEGEHTDEADLGAGGSASEEKTDEQATKTQMEEYHQVEQEETVNKTEEETDKLTVVKEGTIPKAEKAAEDVIPSSGVNMEDSKEVQEVEETEGETETVSVMEAYEEEEADDMIPETDTVAAASKTVIPDEVLDESAAPVPKEPQEKHIGSEIPKLQKATIILVDLKTTCHHLSVKEAEETPVDGECAAPEKEQMEMKAIKEKEESSCVAEEQIPEPEMLVLEEEDGGKQKNSTETYVDATAEAETSKKKELEENYFDKEKEESANVDEGKSEGEEAPVIETRVLRSGRKTVEASCKSASRSNQQQGEGNKGESITENEVDKGEAENSEEEEPAVTTRTLRWGRISASATAKGRSTITHKQIQEEAQKGEEESKSVEETGVEVEEAVKEEAVEKTDKEIEENIKGEIGEKVKSVCRNRKQLQKEEGGAKKSAEVEEEEEEEAGLGSAEEAPTEGDEMKAPEEDKIEEEKEELVTLEVEKGVSEEGTMSLTEENTAGVTAAADNLEVQGGETDTPLPKPTTDSIFTPSEEEKQSEEMAPQLSELQRVTVVLVDLKKKHHDVQEETAAVKKGVPVEKTAAEAEEEQGEETMAGSPVKIKKTELEKVVVKEEGFEEKVEDAVTIQDRGEGRAEETAEEDAVKATSRRKLARSREENGEEEKDEASGIRKESVQMRVLRRGRKSMHVAHGCTTKGTHKQLQEEDKEEVGGQESTAVEEREAEDEEEQAEEQQQMIDQEKGEEKDETQQVENIEPEMGVENADTVAVEAVIQQDAPEEGHAGSTETIADEDVEASVGQSADEGKTLDDVAEEAVITQDTVEREQSTSTSEVVENAAGESAQETPLRAKDDEAKGVSEKEEAPVIETRVLRSGEKIVRATTRSKIIKIQDDEQEEEATGENSTEGYEPAVETRYLRKGRQSAATATLKSKKARTQCETKEEGEDETIEDMQVKETKPVLGEAEEKGERRDEKIEERNEEEAAAQKEEKTEPEVEMEKVEAVAEESLTEQETVEEEQSSVSETCADGQKETLVGESAEETPNTDEGKCTDEEEGPVVETRVLRSGGKVVKATPRSKTTQSQQEENEQEGAVVEKSADTYEPAVETRVLRKRRRSAPATPRHKSKRERTQCQPEEEGEEETTAEETEGVEEEAGQELTEDKREKAEEEVKSMEMEVKKEKDVEEEEVGSAAEGESAVGDAEQMKVASTEEAAVLEKEDSIVAAVDETGTDMVEISSAEVEETNSAEEEETTVIAATEVRSDTAIAEEKALVEDASVMAEKEAPAVTTIIQVVETQQQEEETQEEVLQLTDDSPENRELNAEEQAETEDTAEDQAKETAGEEPATEETESPEEELSESKEVKTVDSSVVGGRSLRKRMKTVADKEEDKAEEIQLPKRRSIRRRPKVDYRENDEEDEGGETEAVTDKEEEDKVESDEDKDNKKAECSANEPMEDEEDEQNMSEEETEPVVIGKRVLRGRSVPEVIITPQSKSRWHSAKVQKAEESMTDEEKNPRSAQKRSLRKRKSTEVTPTRKSKRISRV